MIDAKLLYKLYFEEKKSLQEIADIYGCSLNKVYYWFRKHGFKSRSRGEAAYIKYNPDGDPFRFTEPRTKEQILLFGMGLGLYWGEGTKASKASIRLGNSDPALIKTFIVFLKSAYNINKDDLQFGLQIFSDINPEDALKFWAKNLKVSLDQFHKPIITPSRGKGSYKRKLKYGVLTVYYNNVKLRKIIGKELERFGYQKRPT